MFGIGSAIDFEQEDAMFSKRILPSQHSPLAGQRPGNIKMTKTLNVISIGVATVGVLCMLRADPAVSQEKHGVIPHPRLWKTILPGTADLEAAVYETEYAPGGINPRHLHPAAITFYVVSGTGVWQEDGKPPVTLHTGDSLFVPAGTIHSHWNPSTTDQLRFLEFIVAEKDKGRSIPEPMKK